MVRLIGLRGRAGAGKDTVADYLVDNYGFKKLSFATALKRIVVIITGWSWDFVNGSTSEYRAARETLVHPSYNMTCRQLLQYVGTDLFRNQLHKDIWITCLTQEIKAIWKDNANQAIVISDVRFDNEAEIIQTLAGQIIKINRPQSENGLGLETKNHISEADFFVSDEIVLLNDKSIQDLQAKIDHLLKERLHIKD